MKAAVVGYGYWGVHIVRNLVSLLGPDGVIVCDHDPQRRTLAERANPGVELVARFPELCTRSDIDAIAIVTPVETHYELTRQALAGSKHVFVEKPMTRTSSEAARLVDIAESRGLVLMVDHTFLFTGAVGAIKDLIQREALGRILSYDSCRANLGTYRRDVDVVYDLAVHDLAILDHLFGGSAAWVRAEGLAHPYDHHTSEASLVFAYEEFLAQCRVSWLSPVKIRRITITGTAATVIWDDTIPESPLTVYECALDSLAGDRLGEVFERRGRTYAPRAEGREALEAELSYFLECIEHRRQPVVCDGRSGHRTVRTLEIIERALRTGSRVRIAGARVPQAVVPQ